MEPAAKKANGATYAIGDIQGCFEPLERLLERVRFGPGDRAWLVGDLVNRGPRSLDVLRWAIGLGDRATVVLGNHELSLLACAVGARELRKRDTFEDVLNADDANELVDWLIHRPFLHREGKRVMVHAGLHPAWTLDEATALAGELGEALSRKPKKTLEALESVRPSPVWKDALARRGAALDDRVRADARAHVHRRGPDVRLRRPAPPRAEGVPALVPGPGAARQDAAIVFGHWAALGFHRSPGVLALDSGCFRGQVLTAVRLDDGQVYQEPAQGWSDERPR